MRRSLLILSITALLISTAFGQFLQAPPTGRTADMSVEMAPPVIPEQPLDWPWVGTLTTAVISPTGITNDGASLYMTDWTAGSIDNYIYKVNPGTGAIEGQIPGPSDWPGGIAFDGTYFWITDYLSGMVIFKVDQLGNVIASYPIAYSLYWAGVAWDGQYVYFGNTAGTIYKLDPTTGAVIGNYPVPSGQISGLCYYDGFFYYSDSDNYMIHKMDTNFTIVESSPAYLPNWLADVTVLNGYLWNVDHTAANVNYYDLGAAPPDFDVNLTYVSGSPVPAGGGNLFFDIFVQYNGTVPINYDAWLAVEYEGGPPTTVVLRALTNYMPGWVINRPNTSFPVPGAYAAGNYMHYGRVGDEPGVVWQEDGFPWVKSGASDGSNFQPFPVAGADDPFDTIDKSGSILPTENTLIEAYPNPFNPTTAISIQLSAFSHVTLSIYDVTGSNVATLIDGYRNAGAYKSTFDATNLPSGIYFARVMSGDFVQTQKLVLMK